MDRHLFVQICQILMAVGTLAWAGCLLWQQKVKRERGERAL